MAIRAFDLKKSFGTPPQDVLKGISLTINEGEFVAITGRSGSGKSTLLYIISSLDAPTSGRVEIDGRDLTKMSDVEIHEFRNEKMGFIFQFHYLLPELTALENVLMPARRKGSEEQRRERAINLLDHFGMSSKVNHLPGQMSGGEQQRVAVARSLIMQPKYLFADEPTGNLDSVNGNIVLDILKDASRSFGAAVVMVTHDRDFALRADRQIELSDGLVMDQEEEKH